MATKTQHTRVQCFEVAQAQRIAENTRALVLNSMNALKQSRTDIDTSLRLIASSQNKLAALKKDNATGEARQDALKEMMALSEMLVARAQKLITDLDHPSLLPPPPRTQKKNE